MTGKERPLTLFQFPRMFDIVREHWFDDVATEVERVAFIGSLDG
ncbi:hypothetical protein ACVWXO_004467 [Bradyrhizobium sp. LM2.7]